MNDSESIHLDLAGCTCWFELHQRIKIAFDFPDCYGCNWDAFYDFLCTEVPSCHVIVTGAHTLPRDLQDCLTPMAQALEDAQKARQAWGDILTYEILS